jgi:hypothetical protein
MMSRKDRKRDKDGSINIGGGAYIGGKVSIGRDFVGRDKITITGDGNVVGDHSSATVIKQVREGVTLEEFLRLLAELRAALPAAGLDPETATVVEADVRAVEEQAQREKPRGSIILAKLKGIAELLGAAVAASPAAARLAPLAQQAIQWAQQLFH